MLKTHRLSIVDPGPKPPDYDQFQQLALDGKPLSTRIEGDRISFQLEWRGLFILGTEWDCLDTCYFWFYLIDGTGRILDRVSPPACFGFIDAISTDAAGSVGLSFYPDNDRWRINLHDRSIWSFAWSELKVREGRYRFGKRYFSLVQESHVD